MAKNQKFNYIPWTGLGLVVGMWLGHFLGQQFAPDQAMLYSGIGLAIGLVFGSMVEHLLKKGGR